jgi:hypothetical protein
VGGFRVGTFPDFQAAASVPDPVAYLRRLTPYAAVVSASTLKFAPDKAAGKAAADDEESGVWKHQPYDLEPLVAAILSVGYDGTLAVEYRGTGDAKVGVMRSRQALERLLEGEPAPAEDDEDE